MVRTLLSSGFQFHSTDVELVRYYLRRKALGKKLHLKAIVELDIEDLPPMSAFNSGDLKYHFCYSVENIYGFEARVNRTTTFGYWKTTGKDMLVKYNDETVEMIKTLVFTNVKLHEGRGPTAWCKSTDSRKRVWLTSRMSFV